ncbi:MAG: hypothetical protein ABI652_08620 [Acidobacteriota bacterium]
MHDYLDILGILKAPTAEIRRTCGRHVRRSHPDFTDVPAVLPSASRGAGTPDTRDIAVDFAELSPMIERMQTAFFTHPE